MSLAAGAIGLAAVGRTSVASPNKPTIDHAVKLLHESPRGIEIWYYPSGDRDAQRRVRAAAEERIGNGRSIVMVPTNYSESTQSMPTRETT
jgi:hypothetical protein